MCQLVKVAFLCHHNLTINWCTSSLQLESTQCVDLKGSPASFKSPLHAPFFEQSLDDRAKYGSMSAML